jgi:peptidoglycan/xylan/chitin deacetylase (PgdA/CDA1 family)
MKSDDPVGHAEAGLSSVSTGSPARNAAGAAARSRAWTLLRTVAARTVPGDRSRLSILLYHRVLERPDPLNDWDPIASEFDGQMRALSRFFTPLPLSEGVERLRSGKLPAHAACVTFDDGYRDNVDVALPILRRHGVPATFFIATGYLNGGRMWNDTVVESIRASALPELDLKSFGIGVVRLSTPELRRKAIGGILAALKHLRSEERAAKVAEIEALSGNPLPDDLMMRDDDVRSLRASGMEIGAHTETHPILTRLSSADARREINEGREYLTAILSEPVSLFAYPNGKPGQDYTAEHVRMVRDAGFGAAVSTAWGVASRGSDLFQLPRFTPWDRRPARFALRLLLNRRNAQPVVV